MATYTIFFLRSDTKVARLLAIPTPPPSPLSSWSSPLPQIPSPPLPSILSPLPVSSPPPASPIRLLGYRAAMIRLRAEAPSTSHSLPLPPPIILSHTRSDAPSSGTPPLLPIPLPTSSPPLHLLSTDRRADRPEVTLPPWKRLGIALGLRYEVGESSSAPTARPPRGFRADYGFVATMDRGLKTRVSNARTAQVLEAEGFSLGMSERLFGGSTAGSDYRVTGSGPQETGSDYRDAGSGPQEDGSFIEATTKLLKRTSDPDVEF
ncbi:hypothetical protein Tco_0816916 [Tanacetum coccineum]